MSNKPDYYYQQSAVVPVRQRGDNMEVLMITSRKAKRWIIPKGIIESGLSPADSAAKEALEEAGISGEILPEVLGSYCYDKWGGTCSVQVFVMQVTQVQDVWLEDFRDRVWLSLEDAIERINEMALQKMLKKLPVILETSKTVF